MSRISDAIREQERIRLQAVGNELAEEEQERRGMRSEARRVFVLGVLFVVVVFTAMVMPTFMFRHSFVQMTPAVFLDQVAANLSGLVGVFTGNGSAFENRFMAVIVCAASGAALGLCGSTYQGAFNNPLAAPKTLGVMSGGALGALVYVLWLQAYEPAMPGAGGAVTGAQIAAWQSSLSPWEWAYLNYGRCLCSIAGCFVVVAIVIGLTTIMGKGRLSNIIIVRFCQVFSVGVTAVIQFARYYFTVDGGTDMAQQLAEIENYSMIGIYYFRDLLIVVAPIALCAAIILLMRNRLTLLSFGDDVANTMGVNVNRTRYITIALCTVLTGLAISFCGHVAFLGFISAHLARRIVGPDFRYLLPASVFVGGTFITLVQWVCQSGLPFTSQYAAGPVCSILGAALFIVLIVRSRGGVADERG